jgi:hypothetical protein
MYKYTVNVAECYAIRALPVNVPLLLAAPWNMIKRLKEDGAVGRSQKLVFNKTP